MSAKPFSRKGLHRLECGMCPCYGYFTVAMLEQLGEAPDCLARECIGRLEPTELDLAFMLGLDDAAVVVRWRELTHNSELSQLRSVRGTQRAAERRSLGTLNPMDVKAADEIRQERRENARAARLAALRPAPRVPDPMPF